MSNDICRGVSSIHGIVCPYCEYLAPLPPQRESCTVICVECVHRFEVTTSVSPLGFTWSTWRLPPGAPKPFLPARGVTQ